MAVEDICFSVIVPFKNAAHHLPDCLNALFFQKHRNFEIILVDNNSTDRSQYLAREYIKKTESEIRVTILEQKIPGASAARNMGAKNATGDWLAFTDADCIPDPEWLFDLAHAAAQPDVGALAGCILPAPPENIIAEFLGLYTLPAVLESRKYQEYSILRGGFPSANLTVKRGLFRDISGFDESILIYGEDFDLCARVYQTGSAIRTLTGARVMHKHRSDIKGMIKQTFGFGNAHGLLLKKNPASYFILTAPGLAIHRKNAHFRCWIDLNQADKKLGAVVLAALFWKPLWALALLFYGYLVLSIFFRHRRALHRPRLSRCPVLAALLVLKSAALTCGRVRGSVKNRVVCI